MLAAALARARMAVVMPARIRSAVPLFPPSTSHRIARCTIGGLVIAIGAVQLAQLHVITPLSSLGLLDGLKQELPLYLAAATTAPSLDRGDVQAYTEAVLAWWRQHGGGFCRWAFAARIVFGLSPNSASCERVFSLLKLMFGEQQMSALADYIRAALMLRYNKRRVG